jgi:SP family myo-inositol transporter-like MFS transporter 13
MPTEDEEHDLSHQPLLPAASSDHDVVHAPELRYVGGWFIWALTFSAGISGLLFGYE